MLELELWLYICKYEITKTYKRPKLPNSLIHEKITQMKNALQTAK